MTTALDPLAFTFDRKSHSYHLGSMAIPSVTQVLKSCGLMTEWSMDPAALRRGTRVHCFTEYLDQNDLDYDQVEDEELGYVRAWETFKKQSGFTIIRSEVKLYHPVFMFAGTFDREGMFPTGDMVVLDIKTGSISPATAFQLAAYEILIGAPRKRVAVELHDDGTYKIEVFGNHRDQNMFLSALSMHNWKVKAGIRNRNDK